VICNRIGAVSPPTAPLLFITTGIAKTSIDQTNRHAWTFMLAETLVLVLVILIPELSSSIRATSSNRPPREQMVGPARVVAGWQFSVITPAGVC
jgi:TRAP-type uncharacterized transport system fused permease subunit